MKFGFEKNIFGNKKEPVKNNEISNKKEGGMVDFFSDSYKEEVLPIIEIIKPDDMSLEEYQEQVKEDLLETIKKNQLVRKNIVASPEEMTKEAKEVLMLKLKAVLEDSRNYELKKKPDPELVKKAKIALLYENDMSDAEKYFGNLSDKKFIGISKLKEYIVSNDNKNKFTESDITSLLKTKFAKNLSSLQNDTMYYLGDYGSLDSLPQSLMIALVKAEEGSASKSHFYYVFESGLEIAEEKKYSITCLEQLLAKGDNNLCLEFADKFEDGALDKIIKSGISENSDPRKYLEKFELSDDDFAKYLDLAVKHMVGGKIRDSFGKYRDKNGEAHSHYQDLIDNKLQPVEDDASHNLGYDLKNFSTIKEVVSDGYVGLALATHYCHKYVERYAQEDYENFKKNIEKYDQEHLVFGYLKENDRVKYAQKLIEQGEEYQIVRFVEKFDKHSLGRDIFEKINKKELAPALKGKISIFKDLKEEDALDFVDRGRVNIFVNNLESFNFSDKFLFDNRIQEASFLEFKDAISFPMPENGRIFYDKIPLPKEKTQTALLNAVSDKLENKRIDWACSLIKVFPEVKPLLQEEKFYQQALEGLNNSKYGARLVDILESFPLPDKILNDENLLSKVTNIISEKSYDPPSGKNDKEKFASIRRDYDDVTKINNFVKLPQHFIDFDKVIDKVESLSFEADVDVRVDLLKILNKKEDPIGDLDKCLELLNETKSVKGFELDKTLTLAYISHFLNNNDESEKKKFFQDIKNDIESLAGNKSFDFDNKNYYEYVSRQVYPERNYDTYKNLDQYEDLSHHLDKYKFNKDGYNIKLSGVLGYKVKEGFEPDQKLLDDFSARIKGIKNLAKSENLINFLNENLVDSKTETLEGKILEYFKQNNYSIDTMNALLAYQLLGSYDDFANASSDRLSAEADKTSRDFVLLDEVANQYGDNMKETIKLIHSKVVNSPDKNLFLSDNKDKEEKKYQEAFLTITKDLSKIPREKLNDDAIKKKIGKTIKNVFQGFSNIQNKADYFSSLFSLNDFDNFEEIWRQHVDEFLMIGEESSIDSAKIESLQASVFNVIQSEINKYEEIKEVDTERGDVKLKKERTIKGYFSKNKENAHARMIGDICIATDPYMLKKENYFEFVLFDQEKNKCAGTVMLLEMNEPEDGKKYLLYGPNPSVSLVSEVSAKKLYSLLTKNISTFAKDNNFDAVLVDKTHGRSTNRAGLFQQSLEQSCLKDKNSQELVFNLKNSHLLGGSYSYKDGLRAVWEKSQESL